jgi:MoaA/NifB/PqqE/SkfB family radical SAM enzyme
MTRLIDGGYAKNVILRYDTNLTVINNKVIEKFKHFRKIIFCVSVDDTDERYGLIRFPGNYNNIVNNIKSLKENNMEIEYISCCVDMAAIYSMIRITELAEELNVPTLFRFLEGPGWHDIRSLPKSAKIEIIEKYKSLKHHSNNRTKWYKALIKLLEKYMDYEHKPRIREFVTTMDKLDRIRGTDWRTTLPDVCDILRRHCPEAGA